MAEKFCPFTKENCDESCQLYVKNTIYGNGCVFTLNLMRSIGIEQGIGRLIKAQGDLRQMS